MTHKLLAVMATVLAATIAVLFLFAFMGNAALGVPDRALAAPSSLHTVCPAGPPQCDFSDVQEAVDFANEGDMIKLAAGTYTGVSERAGVTQTVYISKSLIIQGGYTTAFIDPPDPQANPTTLDAQGQGRVLYITGMITPTLAGLRLANGDTSESGAGIYVLNASPVISNCQVFNNSADSAGGGVYLYASANAILAGNRIYDNEAISGVGGGVYLYSGLSASLEDNEVFSNTTSKSGGGIYIGNSVNTTILRNSVYSNTAADGGGILMSIGENATLAENQFMDNSASSFGGAIYLSNSDRVMLQGNHFTGNEATFGGGVYANYSLGPVYAQLDGNRFMENEALLGGAAYLFGDNTAIMTLTNNLVFENIAKPGGDGSGLYIKGFSPILLHTTIARNTGGSGSGVSVTSGGVVMTNTVVVSQTTGIYVPSDSSATLEATLWGSGDWANGDDWGGGGVVLTGTINLWGDPAFVDPDAGDYHLTLGSPAIDTGTNVNASDHDFDGAPRPQDGNADGMAIADMGAFEFPDQVPPSAATITGPTLGVVDNQHTFTAAVDPISTTLPVTYSWQATGQMAVTHTGDLTDSVTFSWSIPGSKILTVTAANLYDAVADTHIITITEPMKYVYLPLVLKSQDGGGNGQTGAPISAGMSTMPIMVPSFEFSQDLKGEIREH